MSIMPPAAVASQAIELAMLQTMTSQHTMGLQVVESLKVTGTAINARLSDRARFEAVASGSHAGLTSSQQQHGRAGHQKRETGRSAWLAVVVQLGYADRKQVAGDVVEQRPCLVVKRQAPKLLEQSPLLVPQHRL